MEVYALKKTEGNVFKQFLITAFEKSDKCRISLLSLFEEGISITPL